MSNLNPEMLQLHEMVLDYLKTEMEMEPSVKTVELAMKFLKDNNVSVDLSNKQESTRRKLHVIPRLSEDELRLS